MPNSISQNSDINFSDKRNNQLSTKDTTNRDVKNKLFIWIINQGRTIVIFTQIIIILTFLFHFNVDSTVREIVRKVESNQTILNENEQIEIEAIKLAQKASKINLLIENQENWVEKINNIFELTSNEVKIQNFLHSKNLISITGNSSNPIAFQTFLSNLLKKSSVKQIIINSSRYDVVESKYSFSLDVVLTTEKN